jgi:glycosyltransferase involved in cell wall biosynthesis
MPAPELRGARVGVVIPAYRVERQIQKVIAAVPGWVEAVIVVDDKSPDQVAARVAELGDRRVTLIRHQENRGVGGAMRTGFRAALERGLDVIVKMDGDDQMDPSYLPELVQPLVDGRADFTKGNRYASTPSLKQMPLVRLLGNAGLTFLVKLASGYWNIFDPANGYIAVRAEVLARIELERLPDRYFFESGLLIELGKLRAVIADVPMAARYGDEHSSLSIPHTLVTFPPRLLWGLGRRLFWRYFVHDFAALSVFCLLGIPLLLWGAPYGGLVWLEVLRTGVDATPGQVMLAAMPVILGVQFLTQAVVLDIQSVPRTPLSPPIRADEPGPSGPSARQGAGAVLRA